MRTSSCVYIGYVRLLLADCRVSARVAFSSTLTCLFSSFTSLICCDRNRALASYMRERFGFWVWALFTERRPLHGSLREIGATIDVSYCNFSSNDLFLWHLRLFPSRLIQRIVDLLNHNKCDCAKPRRTCAERIWQRTKRDSDWVYYQASSHVLLVSPPSCHFGHLEPVLAATFLA